MAAAGWSKVPECSRYLRWGCERLAVKISGLNEVEPFRTGSDQPPNWKASTVSEPAARARAFVS